MTNINGLQIIITIHLVYSSCDSIWLGFSDVENKNSYQEANELFWTQALYILIMIC